MTECPTVRLFTTGGEFVQEASALPFVRHPQVVFWGERLFVKHPSQVDEDGTPDYFEADGAAAVGTADAVRRASESPSGTARLIPVPIVFKGCSDDRIQFNDHRGWDEVDAQASTPPDFVVLDADKRECLRVRPVYNGSWAFAVNRCKGAEFDQPDWPIRRNWDGYSEVVEIYAPPTCVVSVAEE